MEIGSGYICHVCEYQKEKTWSTWRCMTKKNNDFTYRIVYADKKGKEVCYRFFLEIGTTNDYGSETLQLLKSRSKVEIKKFFKNGFWKRLI